MVSLSLFSSSIIGLMLSPEGIRYVQMSPNKKFMKKKGFLPLDPGSITDEEVRDEEHVLAQLKPWIKQEGLQGKTVHISVPAAQSFVRQVRVSHAADEKVQRNLIELEIQTSVHFPFEHPLYDYVVIDDFSKPAEDDIQVLVTAAPRSLIMSYIRLLESLRLSVASVDLALLAVYRVIACSLLADSRISSRRHPRIPESLLVVHFFESQVEIYIFHHGVPEFIRTFSNEDLDGMQDRGSERDWRDLQMEISRMLTFYQYNIQEGQSRITDMVMAGQQAGKKELVKLFQQSIENVNISWVDLDRLNLAETQADLDEFIVPLGLALRSMDGRRSNFLNSH